MITILVVIHLIVTLFLIGLILMQRSDGDGFVTGGGGGGGFMTGRSTANMLTRSTAILATIFIVLSLAMAIIQSRSDDKSLVDRIADMPAADVAPADAAPAVKKDAPLSVPKPQ